MKRFLLAASVVAGLVSIPSPVTAQALDQTDLEASLQALIDSVVEAGSTPGIQLSVHAPDLGLMWDGAAGVADLETGAPLTPRHGVRIASNTKTYLAAATLRLWEEGRLGLDDVISAHLPAGYTETLRGDGYDVDAITVRHLLTHTSGLYDYADRELYVEAVLADPMHRWTPEEQVGLAVEWGDPYGAAGEVFRYSDTGYVVLGLVIESASGSPLAEALRELLDYERLGFESTWLETLEPAPSDTEVRAHQYMGELDTYDWDPSLDLYGGGGLVATTHDMAAFMRALFAGGLYRHASTADTMLTTVADARAGPPLSGTRMVPGMYRLGVFVREVRGVELYEHTGFWGTLAAYVPGRDIAISVAVTQQESRALFRVFLQAMAILE